MPRQSNPGTTPDPDLPDEAGGTTSSSAAPLAGQLGNRADESGPALGMIGLGRMGSNLIRRIVRAGGTGFVYDHSPATATSLRDELAAEGFADSVTVVENMSGFVPAMPAPRTIWVMVPAEVTGEVIAQLAGLLEPGDIVMDGGNSNWRHDSERAALLADAGLSYLDVGTSGGVWGLERGYCLMVGGADETVAAAAPIFEIIAPGVEGADRTPGRSGEPTPAEHGWFHCGPTGAGHFVKMVHNGIEYGLMAAYAEGLNLLGNSGAYGFDIDLASVTEVWRRGSVVGSWLLDLTASALAKDPELAEFSGVVSDSGEGRWTLDAGVDLAVPMPVLASALFSRFSSRDLDHDANKLLSAMRNEFGGHVEPGGGQR